MKAPRTWLVAVLAASLAVSIVLVGSPARREAIRKAWSAVRAAPTAGTTSGGDTVRPVPTAPRSVEDADQTAIRIDGDLSDWPSRGVSSEVAGDYTGFPEDRIPYIVSLFADTHFLYLGWEFPDDTTDCRQGDGSNDLTSVKFGRSGDEDPFMVDGLMHACEALPEYTDEAILDGFEARWLKVDREAAWDHAWGLRWRSTPMPGGIQARTSFGSGHRTTEWAVPLRLLGTAPCETISIYVFTLHDWRGRRYGSRSAGRPWIRDTSSLTVTVPCDEPCAENWDCTEWESCRPSGVQTRLCLDLNRCTGMRSKPEQVRRCTAVPPIDRTGSMTAPGDLPPLELTASDPAGGRAR
jgi:hypothetical protein